MLSLSLLSVFLPRSKNVGKVFFNIRHFVSPRHKKTKSERNWGQSCKTFLKWANTGLFLFIFGLFKQTIQFLQFINVKKMSKCPSRIRRWDSNP